MNFEMYVSAASRMSLSRSSVVAHVTWFMHALGQKMSQPGETHIEGEPDVCGRTETL